MDINECNVVFMNIAEKVKNTTRHSWTSSGRQQKVWQSIAGGWAYWQWLWLMNSKRAGYE